MFVIFSMLKKKEKENTNRELLGFKWFLWIRLFLYLELTKRDVNRNFKQVS